ncbi:hypothetical protein SLA2020_072030 [Shorea laevis]
MPGVPTCKNMLMVKCGVGSGRVKVLDVPGLSLSSVNYGQRCLHGSVYAIYGFQIRWWVDNCDWTSFAISNVSGLFLLCGIANW